MKKNLLWMLAAILLCGLTTTMFTACGGDDEDNQPNSGQQDNSGTTESTTYEVTFTVLAPTNAFDFMSYDFTYADDKGNRFTKEIDSDMSNESLTEKEKADLNTYLRVATLTTPNFTQVFTDYRAQHFTLKNLSTGSTIHYELVMHPNSDYQPAEGEAFAFVSPLVNVVQTPKNGTATVLCDYESRLYSFKDTAWEDFKSRMEGRKLIDRDVTVGQKKE